MRKWIALLLAILMLLMAAGCQSSEEKKDRNDDEREEDSADRDEDSINREGEAAYEIVEIDSSIRNENGDILVRRSYQKVILVGDDPAYEAINERIEEDCEDFLSSGEYWTAEELEEMLAFNGLGYDSFYNMAYAEVMENENGVLRIHISVDWYMGGVTDSGGYDLVFDLETGELIPEDTEEGVGTEEEILQEETIPYEIVEVDNSIVNENGDILVRRTYQKVVLLSDDPACAAINAWIEADCDAFLADNVYMSVEDWEAIVEQGGYGYDAFFETAVANVTHNADGILSIRIGMDHFQGGVYNTNFYGLTYDLTTGEEAKLADLVGLPEEETLALLNDVACEGLKEYYGDALFGDPMEVLVNYTLDNYSFYVDCGELVLTFTTYEFAYGAAGPATIYTGIFVGE